MPLLNKQPVASYAGCTSTIFSCNRTLKAVKIVEATAFVLIYMDAAVHIIVHV